MVPDLEVRPDFDSVIPDAAAFDRWRAGHRIVGVYEDQVTKQIGGQAVTLRGSRENPVILVETRDGGRALQRASDLAIIGQFL